MYNLDMSDSIMMYNLSMGWNIYYPFLFCYSFVMDDFCYFFISVTHALTITCFTMSNPLIDWMNFETTIMAECSNSMYFFVPCWFYYYCFVVTLFWNFYFFIPCWFVYNNNFFIPSFFIYNPFTVIPMYMLFFACYCWYFIHRKYCSRSCNIQRHSSYQCNNKFLLHLSLSFFLSNPKTIKSTYFFLSFSLFLLSSNPFPSVFNSIRVIFTY